MNEVSKTKGFFASLRARTCLTIITGILITFSGPAKSLELDQSPPAATAAGKISSYTHTPQSAIAGDKCLSLLKSVRYDNAPSAMDRTQRSAGTATALGLVFGVRFALGPKEVMKNRSGDNVTFELWEARNKDTNASQALAIADYRRCKNEQSLRALSDLRWQR
jgi:hypothetical protein